MPINATLLERIENNDPSLETLNLNAKALNDSDIQQLVKALAANTILTTLNVAGNQIGDEGAKALAANTTLTALRAGGNWIGAEGAKALAANTTLTALGVEENQIGAEGAKALAANTTLTDLDVWGDEIGDEELEQLEQAIARNKHHVIKRRDQFIQKLILLACDNETNQSQSLWSALPPELKRCIISLIDFNLIESIGKRPQQIRDCADFLFNHASHLRASLSEAAKTQQDFKLIERTTKGSSQFRFFPAQAQTESVLSNQEKNVKVADNLHKRFKTF